MLIVCIGVVVSGRKIEGLNAPVRKRKKNRFKVHCIKVKGDSIFQLKSLRLEHNCDR